MNKEKKHDINKLLEIFKMNYNNYSYEKLNNNYDNIIIEIEKKIENKDKKYDYIKYLNKIKFQIIEYFNNILDSSYERKLLKIENPNTIQSNQKFHIDKKEINTVDSFINKYPKGFINPIRRKIIKKTLIINSKFRKNFLNSNTNDFIIDLFEPLKNVISMSLSTFEIPNSSYAFSEYLKTNTFIIDDLINQYTITIPDGNYKVQQFIDQLRANNSILNTTTGDYNIEINFYNGKTTISKNDNTNFNLNFETSNNFFLTLGYLLGFRKSEYSGQSSYTSESIFDSGGNRYGFVYIDDFNSNYTQNLMYNLTNNTISKNLLTRILTRNGKYTILFDEPIDGRSKTREYFGPVNIDKLHIKILDEFNNLIDLNNMDYSIGLDFEIIYE